MRVFAAVLAASAVLVQTSDARMLSLLTGQGPDLADAPPTALDAGVTLGDDSDYLGGRFNQSVGDNLQLFAEIGYADLDLDVDGPALGGGAYLQLPVDTEFTVGLRGSFNYGMLEGSEAGLDVEVDVWVLTALAVIGGETSVDGLGWYANVGLAHFDGDVEVKGHGLGHNAELDSDTELLIGGGLNFIAGDRFTVFVGAEHVDDLFFGGGVRLGLE